MKAKRLYSRLLGREGLEGRCQEKGPLDNGSPGNNSRDNRSADKWVRRGILPFILYLIGLIPLAPSGSGQEVAQLTAEAKIDSLLVRVDQLKALIRERELMGKPGAILPSHRKEGRMLGLRRELASLRKAVVDLSHTLHLEGERMRRVQISGRERIRLMNIDTKGKQPRGIYGEPLKEQTTLKYYLRLNLSAAITERIAAGGRLRISNVSRDVLDRGPEYLSQEWGSAFFRYSTENFAATVGCYDIHFTPFTLMRWDAEDNPEGGGRAASGCLACGEVVGTIPSESLEELTSTLSFEGIQLRMRLGRYLDGVGIYARRSEREWIRYRRHTVGLRTRFIPSGHGAPSAPYIGITILKTGDESGSVEFPPLSPLLENNLLDADVNLPIIGGLSLNGEWALGQVKEDSLQGGEPTSKGSAVHFGLKMNRPPGFKFRGSYLRLDRSFDSFYRALSYNANRRGFRASSTLELLGSNLSVSTFVKVLKEIEPSGDVSGSGPRLNFYTASIGGSFSPTTNLLIRPSFIYQGERRDENPETATIEEVKGDTFVLVNEAVLKSLQGYELLLRYQHINFKDRVNSANNFRVGQFFILFDLYF